MTANISKIVLLSCSMAACDVPVDSDLDYELSGGAQVSPDEAHSRPAALDSHAPRYTHASAGYLVLDDSPIEPWCGAVLVAPDVVMTSAACVESRGASRLAVGFAIPNAGADLAIDRIVVLHADARLAALVLAEPLPDLEPALVATLERDRCDIESISYRYVVDDDVSDRWVWSGCFEAETGTLVPDDGAPNCHGDNGAPAFSSRGDLVGIVVGAESGTLCIDSVALAVPSEGGAYEEALALSR